MNKELRAAQDQLDRAAKRGWSPGRNVALHLEPRRIIAYLLFMEFYKCSYITQSMSFLDIRRHSVFSIILLMLQQTKLFFVLFYKI